MEIRNSERREESNAEVIIDPEIAKIFRASTELSGKLPSLISFGCSPDLTFTVILAKKGTGADLLKIKAVRRKTKA